MKSRLFWAIIIFCALMMIILGYGCQEPSTTPKIALTIQTINNLKPNEEQSIVEAAKYDMLIGYNRPEYISRVRQKNPDNISLYQTNPTSVFKPELMTDNWMVNDTLWSLDRLKQWYVKKNAEMGCDWLYRNVDGSPIERWHAYEANWSCCCQEGLYGDSKGLTYKDWLVEKAIKRIIDNDTFKKSYDGFEFDVIESCMNWDTSFENVDIDEDGVSDGGKLYCGSDQYNRFRTQTEKSTEEFLSKVMASVPNTFIVMDGQDRVTTESATKINAWKIENWMRQDGASKNWIDWWNGTNNTTGYFRAEQKLNRYGDNPLFDTYQGWDLSVLELKIPKWWSPYDAKKFARFGLGTSMLGDGYFSVKWEDYSFMSIPEMFSSSWRMRLPAKSEVYQIGTKYCRDYIRDSDGKYCTLIVDPVLGDAMIIENPSGAH